MVESNLLFLFIFKVLLSLRAKTLYFNLQYLIYDHLGAVKTTCKWGGMPFVKYGRVLLFPKRSCKATLSFMLSPSTAALVNSFGSAGVMCSWFGSGGLMKQNGELKQRDGLYRNKPTLSTDLPFTNRCSFFCCQNIFL